MLTPLKCLISSSRASRSYHRRARTPPYRPRARICVARSRCSRLSCVVVACSPSWRPMRIRKPKADPTLLPSRATANEAIRICRRGPARSMLKDQYVIFHTLPSFSRTLPSFFPWQRVLARREPPAFFPPRQSTTTTTFLSRQEKPLGAVKSAVIVSSSLFFLSLPHWRRDVDGDEWWRLPSSSSTSRRLEVPSSAPCPSLFDVQVSRRRRQRIMTVAMVFVVFVSSGASLLPSSHHDLHSSLL